VLQLLRYWGHDAEKLREVLPVTSPDLEVFAYAQQAGRLIVSCNRDHFLALALQALKEQRAFAGLIVLIRRRTRQAECAHLLALLRRAGDTGLSGNVNFA
jgi:predicted nuclease of predicted toxin-antitoxin system